jgi:hypothetical protein
VGDCQREIKGRFYSFPARYDDVQFSQLCLERVALWFVEVLGLVYAPHVGVAVDQDTAAAKFLDAPFSFLCRCVRILHRYAAPGKEAVSVRPPSGRADAFGR